MDNPTKTDRIFDLLPEHLGAQQDPKWNSLIQAIGAEDERLAQLAEEVRKQFFVKTANRPHIDRLAANSNLLRPRFVGMSDTDFRRFIPILTYQPKQVKRIIDEMLDLFFMKEATTAFLSSGLHQPFALQDTWNLEILVDNTYQERIVFQSSDFTNIAAATADEIAAAYNRQAKYSYAVSFYDSVTKNTFLRIFSKTIGAQGAMDITGGLANIAFEFNGFLSDLGLGSNTQWVVTKVGNTTTFTYNAGTLPGVESLLPGDIFLCDLANNRGSFVITSVNVRLKSFTFENILAQAETVTQSSPTQVKWMRPVHVTSFSVTRRALAWETGSNAINIEMPATPPIVYRSLKGGFHINGEFKLVTAIDSSTSLTVDSVVNMPPSGQFIIEPVEAITANLTGGPGDEVVSTTSNGRIISNFTRYHYAGITGNTLTGITPNLPSTSVLHELTIISLVRSSNTVTCTVANDFAANDTVFIKDSTGIPILTTTGNTTNLSAIISNLISMIGVSPGQLIFGTGIQAGTKVLQIIDATTILMTKVATTTATGNTIAFAEDTNGPFQITAADSSSFTFSQNGTDGTAMIAGTVSKEYSQLAPNGSKVLVTSASGADITNIKGPYVWQADAPFTLSADTSTTTTAIVAGKSYKSLTLGSNNIPAGPGYLVFNYGQNNQEGPVRYLYKIADNIVALDPSYTFQQFHSTGTSVVAVSKMGPHTLSGRGDEYPPYVTNPPDARKQLQDLINSVASAGIFIDFIIRYPNQLYGTLEVYD